MRCDRVQRLVPVQVPTASEPARRLLSATTRVPAQVASVRADSRSDTIMLRARDPQTNTLSLLSFPRDLQVPISCEPTTALRTDRINSA